MLSCQKATGLIEKQIYFRLSPLEKLRLRMHMLMCDYCNRYKRQSLFIHELLQKCNHDHSTSNTLHKEDVPELKEKIINQLDKI